MSAFEFATATRIIFGEGKLSEIAAIAPEFGQRALVVFGSSVERAKPLFDLLDERQSRATAPSRSAASRISPRSRPGWSRRTTFDAQMVISFGGGSAIDAGKAIAALATNPGDAARLSRSDRQGAEARQRAAAVRRHPDDAGTGAEVTRNAVIASPEHKRQGQPAQPADAAARRAGRSRTDLWAAERRSPPIRAWTR